MPEVEVSSETIKKIRAFKKVIDVIIGEELPSEADYVETILIIGLNKMVQDPLPKEEMLLKTMVDMFNKNPEFVSEYMAEMFTRGEGDEIRKMWFDYIV